MLTIRKKKMGDWLECRSPKKKTRNVSKCFMGPSLRFSRASLIAYDGLVETEAVVRIVFGLQSPQSVQAPRLVTVDGLEAFVLSTVRVVHIRLCRLVPTPEFPDLFGPCQCRLLEMRSWRNDGQEVSSNSKGQSSFPQL